MMKTRLALVGIGAALMLATGGCASLDEGTAKAQTPPAPAAKATPAKPLPLGLDASLNPDPFPSTYKPLPGRPTAIVGANILTGTGQEIDGGVVLMAAGKIVAVGKTLDIPAGAVVIDGKGRWVTPGVIDAHSHLGVYPTPAVPSRSAGHELTAPAASLRWRSCRGQETCSAAAPRSSRTCPPSPPRG
jgi:hypothetical protein